MKTASCHLFFSEFCCFPPSASFCHFLPSSALCCLLPFPTSACFLTVSCLPPSVAICHLSPPVLMLRFAAFAFCLFPFWVLCRLLPSTASCLPKTSAACSLLFRSSAAFNRILLYATICSFLPSETFCLVPFPSFCCS